MQTPIADKFSDREIHDMCADLGLVRDNFAHDYEHHTRELRAAFERAVATGSVLLSQDGDGNWLYEQAAK